MLTVQEVRHIGSLARIELSEEEIEHYRRDLSAILESFRELEKLDTSNVQALPVTPGMDTVVRQDKTRSELLKNDSIVANMPSVQNGFLKVRSFFE